MLNKAKLLKIIRWRDWATGKLPVFFAIGFYIILAYSKYSLSFIMDFLIFFAFITITSIYGYLINEFSDRQLDKQHGKSNTFENVSNVAATFIIILLFLLTVFTGVRFVSKKYFVLLWIAQMFLATFYSMRPLRFKERGLLGIIAASSAQFPLPIMLLFSAFGEFGEWDMWSLACCTTIIGLSWEIGHQRYDLINDAKTQTSTLGVRRGIETMTRIHKRILLIERISWLIVVLVLLIKVPYESFPFTFSPILPLVFLFAILFGIIVSIQNQ